ncbi:hypothetical protein BRC86_04285 [Halobacteriales archaeon QS_3_64_16]|nr:MAG: hypothetical protein BRC86_04285 [Halobacteriales archaeon QS_3_64_16]
MLRGVITDLATDRRWEVLALVVLVNFGLAFALGTTIGTGTTLRAGVFLVAFGVIAGVEYAAACRWCTPQVRSLTYWIG